MRAVDGFIGSYRDPVRNVWIIDFGLISCAGIILLAMIAGPIRGIPFGCRCIDCSFGVLAAVPLGIAQSQINSVYRPPDEPEGDLGR